MKSVNLGILWLISTAILILSTNIYDTISISPNSFSISVLVYAMDLLYIAITFLVFDHIYLNFTKPYLEVIKGKTKVDLNI